MKKTYESPSIEKVAFKYRDQVVAASVNINGTCQRVFEGSTGEYGSPCWTDKYYGDNN